MENDEYSYEYASEVTDMTNKTFITQPVTARYQDNAVPNDQHTKQDKDFNYSGSKCIPLTAGFYIWEQIDEQCESVC
jgi:hypothetical protein